MNNNEWPLVFFTLLSQTSVGLVISMILLPILSRNSGFLGGIQLRQSLILAGMILAALALLFSFLHLAKPFHAVHAFSNLSGSWLSREILFASLYLVLLAVCFSSLKFGIPAPALSRLMMITCGSAGLLLIWSMARIYMIPTIPTWNSPSTPIAFFSSAFLLGMPLLLALLTWKFSDVLHHPSSASLLKAAFLVLAFFTVLKMLNMLFVQPDFSAVAGSFPPPALPLGLKVFHLFFSLAGFLVFWLWFFRQLNTPEMARSFSLYLSFLLFCTGEILGRYLFYLSYHRVGV
jgi:DMSO reductase anchor subunit